MSTISSFGSLTQLIRLFLTLLTTVIPCISNTFNGSLQNLQLLLGRCMALIVKRSWLELANRETKQVFKLIFNDIQTCILLRARIQNFILLALIMSSSPLWPLLPIPRTFGSNIQFGLQLPISRPQDLSLRKQGIWKSTVVMSTAFNPLSQPLHPSLSLALTLHLLASNLG